MRLRRYHSVELCVKTVISYQFSVCSLRLRRFRALGTLRPSVSDANSDVGDGCSRPRPFSGGSPPRFRLRHCELCSGAPRTPLANNIIGDNQLASGDQTGCMAICYVRGFESPTGHRRRLKRTDDDRPTLEKSAAQHQPSLDFTLADDQVRFDIEGT